MNESMKVYFSRECFVRGKKYENTFRRLRESCVIMKHRRTNAFMLFTHRKFTIICPLLFSLLLFLSFYITLGRKQVGAVLVCGCRWESPMGLWIKRVKERFSCQLQRISVGEWSHSENIVVRYAAFSVNFITWNFAYIKVLSRTSLNNSAQQIGIVKSWLADCRVRVMPWWHMNRCNLSTGRRVGTRNMLAKCCSVEFSRPQWKAMKIIVMRNISRWN